MTGLLAKLYNGREPTSQPAIEEIDPSVDIRVNAIPLPRPYNVEWTGSILAPQDGTYRFGTNSIDSSTLWIDGQQVLTNTAPNAMVEGTIQLSAGWHDIRVGWLDATGFTHIQMSWTRPGGAPETVPSQALRPWPPAVIAEAQPSDADVAQAAALLSSQPIARGEAPQAPTSGTVLAGSTALSQPRGVTVTPDGTTYIADAGRRAIIEIPPDGGAPRALAQGQLKEPSAVAVLRDRTVLALDAGAGAIWRIDMDTGKLGDRFAPDQGFYGPRGIAVALDGRVAVADTGNNRIVIIPSTGSGAQVIGGLREPTDVAFLPDGSLLVAETGAKQITIVRSDGGRVSSWPMPEAYTVVGPHVAVLPRGGWVATAPEARTLLRMAPNGREPQQWGVDTGFKKPVGIAVSAQGIVVTDTDAGTATTYRAP